MQKITWMHSQMQMSLALGIDSGLSESMCRKILNNAERFNASVNVGCYPSFSKIATNTSIPLEKKSSERECPPSFRSELDTYTPIHSNPEYAQ